MLQAGAGDTGCRGPLIARNGSHRFVLSFTASLRSTVGSFSDKNFYPAVAIITAGDFSVMHFRQFAYGISATALALFQVWGGLNKRVSSSGIISLLTATNALQMLLMVWTTRMLWREQERIEWVQEQEDMDYEALMTGIIR